MPCDLVKPDGHDDGHLGRDEDLSSRQPPIAKEKLAHLVALDRPARRHVVFDEEPSCLDEVEDRVPLLFCHRPEPAVHEDETERPAAAELLVDVPLEQLDVGQPAEALARDSGPVGVPLDGDDATSGLRHDRGRLAVCCSHLGDVPSGSEHPQERLHFRNRGCAARQTSGGASPTRGETSSAWTITASTPARSSSCTSSSVVSASSAMASLPAGTSARSSSTWSSVPASTNSSGSKRVSASSSCSSSVTRHATSSSPKSTASSTICPIRMSTMQASAPASRSTFSPSQKKRIGRWAAPRMSMSRP